MVSLENLGGGDISQVRPDGTGLAHLEQIHEQLEPRPKWSSDASSLAVREYDSGVVSILELRDGTVRNRTELGKCRLPMWSPDGRVLAAACDSDSDATHPAQPGPAATHLVLVSSESRVAFEDYVVGNEALAWSPGDRILFASMVDGYWDFYIAGFHYEAPRRITDYRMAQSPIFAVSPDGNQIAFAVEGVDEIQTVRVDGTPGWSMGVVGSPASLSWSPDGAYVGIATTETVSLAAADGTELVTLAAGGRPCTLGPLVWSPTGDRVVFSTTEGPEAREVTYSADPSGHGIIDLSEVLGLNVPPSIYMVWSPSGDRIAFHESGWGNLYTVHPTGDGLVNVNAALGLDVNIWDFSWAPDGSYLALAVGPGWETFEAVIDESYGEDAYEAAWNALDEALFGIYTVESDGGDPTHILGPAEKSDLYVWVGFTQQEG